MVYGLPSLKYCKDLKNDNLAEKEWGNWVNEGKIPYSKAETFPACILQYEVFAKWDLAIRYIYKKWTIIDLRDVTRFFHVKDKNATLGPKLTYLLQELDQDRKWSTAAKSGLQLPSLHSSTLISLKSLYAALWVINYFSALQIPFLQIKCCEPLAVLSLFRWHVILRDIFLSHITPNI